MSTSTMTEDERSLLAIEIGARALGFLEVENSDWAYKMWFGTGRIWWDAESGTFVEEDRPHMLHAIEITERQRRESGLGLQP
jgi:hypothetical protein